MVRKLTEPTLMDYTFRIYIFDENHKLVSDKKDENEYEYEREFLDNEIEYILVSDMDEVKEDLLNRRFHYGGISEYGIMLEPNKLRMQSLPFGFDNHYIENDEYLIGTLQNWSIGKGDAIAHMYPHMEREHGGMVKLRHTIPEHIRQQHTERYYSTGFIRATMRQLLELDILRIYSYNKKRLGFTNSRIKYIDVNNEMDIKQDLLHSDGYDTLKTYIVLDGDVKVKIFGEGYKNWKVVTEDELEARIEDIFVNRFAIN